MYIQIIFAITLFIFISTKNTIPGGEVKVNALSHTGAIKNKKTSSQLVRSS